MARPRLDVGTHGAITVTAQVRNEHGRWVKAPPGVKAQQWQARTKVRDQDGVKREVTRTSEESGAAAQRALKAALRDRKAPRAGDVLRSGMTVADAGLVWLEQIDREESGVSDSTRRQYRATWDRYVAGSGFAGFTLAEANTVPRVRALLQSVADEKGSGAAKSTRSVVSLLLGMAVGDGVLDVNAARQVKAPRRDPRKRPTAGKGARERDTSRAFTREERDALVLGVRRAEETSGNARRSDLADLVTFLAYIGPRLSEALAVRWEGVDFAAARVRVPGTKTETSDRTLPMHPMLADYLHARWLREGKPTSGFVFCSTTGDLSEPRDARNTWRTLRRLLDGAGHTWATPHTFRRTVATLLDAEGRPLAEIADWLGHADPSVTARVYLGRRGDLSGAAAVL